MNLKHGQMEFVLFGTLKKSKARKPNIMFRSVPVDEVESYEYLGVNMDKSLNYVEHKDKMHQKAMNLVKSLLPIRCHTSSLIAQSIYKNIIEPVFVYCNGIFIGDSYSSITKFQKVQDRAFMHETIKNTTERRVCGGEKSKYIASGMATPLPKIGTPATQVNFFLSLGTAERSMRGEIMCSLVLPRANPRKMAHTKTECN